MKFFLASHAIDPQCLPKLEDFIGGKLSNKSIAYIPTARHGERSDGSLGTSETYKYLSSICPKLKVIELEDIRTKDVLPEFNEMDIIWFAGGYAGYLLYWIRRAQLDKALPDLLNKGAIYVGSSAGAMVCSKTQYSAEFLGDEELGASLIPVLGYLDFEIRPHYTDDMYEDIKAKWQKSGKGELCLLKDGEAITIVDGKVEILGEKRFITAGK